MEAEDVIRFEGVDKAFGSNVIYEGLDLTASSEGIPYDCEAEPEPVGGED